MASLRTPPHPDTVDKTAPALSPCTLSASPPPARWVMITGQWPMAGVEKVEGACGCSGLPVRNEPAISVPARRDRGKGADVCGKARRLRLWAAQDMSHTPPWRHMLPPPQAAQSNSASQTPTSTRVNNRLVAGACHQPQHIIRRRSLPSRATQQHRPTGGQFQSCRSTAGRCSLPKPAMTAVPAQQQRRT